MVHVTRRCLLNPRFIGLLSSVLFATFLVRADAESSVPVPARTGASCFELAGVYEMDFFGFYATDEEAIGAAAELDESVFKVEVREAAVGPEWVVRAAYRQLPTREAHAEQAEAMRIIGARHGSIFSVGCAYRAERR